VTNAGRGEEQEAMMLYRLLALVMIAGAFLLCG